MRPFAYARPASLAEAFGLLADHPDGGARLLAGGTDLVIRLRDGTFRPQVVVDVKRIAELDGRIDRVDGRVRFGALATMTDIAADDAVRRDYPALAEAALYVGSVQIRNRATLAGNVCNASPAADTAPALLVYGAEVVAVGPAGRRRIALGRLLRPVRGHDARAGRARRGDRAAGARRAHAGPCTCDGRGGAATTWRR